jgi:hypothetical protein
VFSRKGVKNMSKFESLLKKIEVFEKLAIHGDRKSFLKSLAQAPGLNPKAKAIVEQMLAIVNGKITDEAITAPLRNIYFNKLDVRAIEKACQQALLDPSLLPDEKLKLQDLSRRLGYIGATDATSPEAAPAVSYDPEAGMSFEADKLTAKKPANVYAAIPKNIQSKINEIITSPMYGSRFTGMFPGGIAVDGMLGPQTRKAIDAIKAKMNLTGKNDSELFQQINSISTSSMA